MSIALALVFILITGCKVDPDKNNATIEPKPPVEKVISLKQTSLDMKIGNEFLLVIDKYDRESENPIMWSSDNQAVATVNGEGLVEAVSEGEANITVTQGTLSATCKVTSGFGDEYAQVVVPAGEEFSIAQGKGFSINPSIYFDGKSFDDGEFEYTLSDEENFSIEDGVITGSASGATTSVTIEGSWRGKTSEDMITLKKTLLVDVIDDVNLLFEGYESDYASVYALPEFDGKTYTNVIPFTPVVYVNGIADENAEISVATDKYIEYDQENNQITGKEFGLSELTITYTNANGKTLAENFYVDVVRPIAKFDKKVNYFSAYKGTLNDDADDLSDKTLFDYLYPNAEEGLALVDAKMGDADLEVVDNKVYGVTYSSTGTSEQTITVGTKTSCYIVDMTVYGQYVCEAQDLNVFTRTSKNLTFDGYVELSGDIDANGYTAGLHFNGEQYITTNYPSTANGYTFTKASYYGGVFDGKGHTISNLVVSYCEPVGFSTSASSTAKQEKTAFGMFSALEGATIKNIAFASVDIKGRTLFGFYSNNSNFENLRIDVKNIPLQGTYQGNVMSYYSMVGGSLKNMFVTVPESIELTDTASAGSGNMSGSFASVPVTTKVARPVFENCIVVSKLPLGYSTRYGAESTITYGINDTDEFIEFGNKVWWIRYYEGSSKTMGNLVLTSYRKLPDADPNKTDSEVFALAGRSVRLEGVYRFNTINDMCAYQGITDILSKFPGNYWLVEGGKLYWYEPQFELEEGQILLDAGEGFRGKDIQGLTTNLSTYQAGSRVVLPTISLFGYEFKGWMNTVTKEMVPVINGEHVIENFDGVAVRYVAVWESTSISGPIV
ncbi:MAG: Ig-like domain-containing protein [Clostridiales bacterium]|nr:Ig-like domain-containing protein [Clostridiales bacterium]